LAPHSRHKSRRTNSQNKRRLMSARFRNETKPWNRDSITVCAVCSQKRRKHGMEGWVKRGRKREWAPGLRVYRIGKEE
jgi:hypothetical protein